MSRHSGRRLGGCLVSRPGRSRPGRVSVLIEAGASVVVSGVVSLVGQAGRRLGHRPSSCLGSRLRSRLVSWLGRCRPGRRLGPHSGRRLGGQLARQVSARHRPSSGLGSRPRLRPRPRSGRSTVYPPMPVSIPLPTPPSVMVAALTNRPRSRGNPDYGSPLRTTSRDLDRGFAVMVLPGDTLFNTRRDGESAGNKKPCRNVEFPVDC